MFGRTLRLAKTVPVQAQQIRSVHYVNAERAGVGDVSEELVDLMHALMKLRRSGDCETSYSLTTCLTNT